MDRDKIATPLERKDYAAVAAFNIIKDDIGFIELDPRTTEWTSGLEPCLCLETFLFEL